MKETEDVVEVVYVRFDKSLDYKGVVNSVPVKKFLESVFGDYPNMVSPKNFEFDRDKLGEFIQDQYDMSKEYIMYTQDVPQIINSEYYKTLGEEGEPLTLCEFETEILLDDHIVTINRGDKVLGVFAADLDFEHILDEYE